jgi:hypothetical protein
MLLYKAFIWITGAIDVFLYVTAQPQFLVPALATDLLVSTFSTNSALERKGASTEDSGVSAAEEQVETSSAELNVPTLDRAESEEQTENSKHPQSLFRLYKCHMGCPVAAGWLVLIVGSLGALACGSDNANMLLWGPDKYSSFAGLAVSNWDRWTVVMVYSIGSQIAYSSIECTLEPYVYNYVNDHKAPLDGATTTACGIVKLALGPGCVWRPSIPPAPPAPPTPVIDCERAAVMTMY